MPFDAAGFSPRPDRRRGSGNDNAATLIIVVSAAALLLTPISAVALVDVVQYFQGHHTGKTGHGQEQQARAVIAGARCMDRVGGPCRATAAAR
jgi:hypothetical protein